MHARARERKRARGGREGECHTRHTSAVNMRNGAGACSSPELASEQDLKRGGRGGARTRGGGGAALLFVPQRLTIATATAHRPLAKPLPATPTRHRQLQRHRRSCHCHQPTSPCGTHYSSRACGKPHQAPLSPSRHPHRRCHRPRHFHRPIIGGAAAATALAFTLITVSPLATAELETATARIPIEAKCTCARVRHTEGVSKCAHGQGRRARVVHPVSKPAPTSRRSNDGPPLGHAPLTQTQPPRCRRMHVMEKRRDTGRKDTPHRHRANTQLGIQHEGD